MSVSSPLTVAQPWRIFTTFPIKPVGHSELIDSVFNGIESIASLLVKSSIWQYQGSTGLGVSKNGRVGY